MPTYAKTTEVAPDRTVAEIRATLKSYHDTRTYSGKLEMTNREISPKTAALVIVPSFFAIALVASFLSDGKRAHYGTSSAPSPTPAASLVAIPAQPFVPAAPAPASGSMVWVNDGSKIYHYPGSRWYRATDDGHLLPEADAIRAGYKAPKNGQ